VSAFLAPVDTVLYGIPHYFKVVKKPMDLGTVETKLIASNPRGPPKDKSKMGNWDESKGTYGSVAEVTEDVRQIWENTRMFNGPDHVVSQNATVCEAAYEKALKNLPAEVSQFSVAAAI
jgi:bromodomain-containing factor 1